MKNEAKFEPTLDLLEIRRQLIAMRSLHSDNRRVTIRINKLIGEIAYLREPDDRAHEKYLIRMIAKTARAVDRIIASDQPAAQTGRMAEGKTARTIAAADVRTNGTQYGDSKIGPNCVG